MAGIWPTPQCKKAVFVAPPPPSPNLRSELANKTGVTKSVASSAVASVMGYGSNDRPISIKLTITT